MCKINLIRAPEVHSQHCSLQMYSITKQEATYNKKDHLNEAWCDCYFTLQNTNDMKKSAHTKR